MKKYISNLGMTYIPKNKAEAASQVVAKEMSRKVLNENEVAAFKKEFQDSILKVNQYYPRCKDLELDIYQHEVRSDDINFSVSGVFSLNLYWGEEQ